MGKFEGLDLKGLDGESKAIAFRRDVLLLFLDQVAFRNAGKGKGRLQLHVSFGSAGFIEPYDDTAAILGTLDRIQDYIAVAAGKV